MNSLQIDQIKNIFINYNDQYEIRKLIANLFIPSLQEKKINAEVSTPVHLVDEMLDKIPLDFWTTPKKVFEPCCGKGNFVIAIVDKFYDGLQNMFPDIIERCNVIFNQCLYYADISEYNIRITTDLLKCYFKYKYNIITIQHFNYYTGNSLQLDIQNEFSIDGFHAVIGNPPYNSPGNTATGNTIWQHFVKKSLNKWLITNGLLVFVHPPGWRKPNTNKGKFYGLYKLMTFENQMIYLSMHDIKDGQQTFNCGTRYDWYLIQKTPKIKNTIVNDAKNNTLIIDMNNFNWLPNYNINTIHKILANENEEKCSIIYSSSAYDPRRKWMSKLKDDQFKYPCIQSTNKSGIVYKYSSVNDKGHFGTSKIIFGFTGINDVIIDMEGKYGLTQGAIGIKIDSIEEAINFKKCLLSNKFKDYLNSCLFSHYIIDWRIFKHLKKDFWKEFIE